MNLHADLSHPLLQPKKSSAGEKQQILDLNSINILQSSDAELKPMNHSMASSFGVKSQAILNQHHALA